MEHRKTQSEQKTKAPVRVVFEFPSYSNNDESVMAEVKRIMTEALQEQLLKTV